jgi:pyruvate formate lyase activating enzyme
LASLLLDDLPFFDSSGGGVTFSGGEPALFSRYCGHTARILKSRSIHLAIQTAGMFPWDEFSQTLLPLLDLVYFDLKALHVDDHKRLTGRDPGPIIENFGRLAAGRTSLIATTVLVPGVSDDPGSIEAMRRFVYGSGVTRFEARPYNAGGRLKRWRPVTVPLRLDPMASMPKQL